MSGPKRWKFYRSRSSSDPGCGSHHATITSKVARMFSKRRLRPKDYSTASEKSTPSGSETSLSKSWSKSRSSTPSSRPRQRSFLKRLGTSNSEIHASNSPSRSTFSINTPSRSSTVRSSSYGTKRRKRFKNLKRARSMNALDIPDLHSAIRSQDMQLISSLLVTSPELINKSDHRLYTPLHLAAEVSSPDVVNLLLLYHADKSAVNKIGLSPFHVAVMNNNIEVAELLVPNKERTEEKHAGDSDEEYKMSGPSNFQRHQINDTRKMLLEDKLFLLQKSHWIGGFVEKIQFQFENRLDKSVKFGLKFTKVGDNAVYFDDLNDVVNVRKNKVYSWTVDSYDCKNVLTVERHFPRCGLATAIGFSCKSGYKLKRRWVWAKSNRLQ